jgi:hypothetical protein
MRTRVGSFLVILVGSISVATVVARMTAAQV